MRLWSFLILLLRASTLSFSSSCINLSLRGIPSTFSVLFWPWTACSVGETNHLLSYYLTNKWSIYVRSQGLEIPMLIRENRKIKITQYCYYNKYLLSYYLTNKQRLHVRSQGVEISMLIRENRKIKLSTTAITIKIMLKYPCA